MTSEEAPADHAGPGLYLHVPFCSAICPYCDFSVLTGGTERRREFTESLLGEIALAPRTLAAEDVAVFEDPFDTIYFGGGTPSALEAEHLARVLEALAEHLPLAARPWIFLEANPEDVTAESLRAWRALGVQTLSLGIQSFRADALAFLGRRHTPSEGRRAVAAAQAAGFHTVSFDLIYGLPEQSLEEWEKDLAAALELEPRHLSCYQLTVHEGTPFGFRKERGQLAELPEPAQGELFRHTHSRLGQAGLPAYEVSSFGVSPEHHSRHNRKYWNHTPYLGLGPSAHSYAGRRRWWNHRKLGSWQQAVAAGSLPREGAEDLAPQDLALEALMLGLRTPAGIDLEEIHRRTGRDLAPANAMLLERLERQGLLLRHGSCYRPTLEGLAVADGLAGLFEV